MTHVSVAAALRGDSSVGATITVKGWVRSKRDSKAGISFIAVHDGSCFDAIQAVVPSELANYTSDVLTITTGCSVVIEGALVVSEGIGQALEMHATRVVCLVWLTTLKPIPLQKNAIPSST